MAGTPRLEPTELDRPAGPPEPPDPPMVPIAIAGMVVWAIATLAVLPLRDEHESWFWICVAGFLWGIPGLLAMIHHDANRRPPP